MNKLKSYPHCGAAAVMDTIEVELFGHQITCSNPDCFFGCDGFETQEEAITAWNTRSSPLINAHEHPPEPEDVVLWLTKHVDVPMAPISMNQVDAANIEEFMDYTRCRPWYMHMPEIPPLSEDKP